jgi:glycosyltransferase involved in cell wall biosynthesis
MLIIKVEISPKERQKVMYFSTDMTNHQKENFFYILIRSRNCYDVFDRCIDSVFCQTYTNYKILFIDDCSDYTILQKQHIRDKLAQHHVQFNSTRKFSVRNAYEILHKYAIRKDAIVVSLDGDDWLLHKNVLGYLNRIYSQKNTAVTYGECYIWDGLSLSDKPSRYILPNVNLPYNHHVVQNNSYRKEPFYPLHLRTFKLQLFNRIHKEDFLRDDGSWIKYAEDLAIFFPILEMAGHYCKVINTPLYVYNRSGKQHDDTQNTYSLIKDELLIRKKHPYERLL